MDDVALVAAVQAGDEAALADLFEECHVWAYSTCLNALRDPEAAEEATSRVLAAVVRTRLAGATTLRPAMTRLIYAACIDVEHDLLRRRRRRRHGDHPPAAPDPHNLRLVAWRAAGDLTGPDRILFALAAGEGVTRWSLAAAITPDRPESIIGRLDAIRDHMVADVVAARSLDDCPTLRDTLRYSAREPDAAARRAVHRHLAGNNRVPACRTCVRTRDRWPLPALASLLPLTPVTAEVHERLLDRMEAALQEAPGRPLLASDHGGRLALTGVIEADPTGLTEAEPTGLTGGGPDTAVVIDRSDPQDTPGVDAESVPPVGPATARSAPPNTTGHPPTASPREVPTSHEVPGPRNTSDTRGTPGISGSSGAQDSPRDPWGAAAPTEPIPPVTIPEGAGGAPPGTAAPHQKPTKPTYSRVGRWALVAAAAVAVTVAMSAVVLASGSGEPTARRSLAAASPTPTTGEPVPTDVDDPTPLASPTPAESPSSSPRTDTVVVRVASPSSRVPSSPTPRPTTPRPTTSAPNPFAELLPLTIVSPGPGAWIPLHDWEARVATATLGVWTPDGFDPARLSTALTWRGSYLRGNQTQQVALGSGQWIHVRLPADSRCQTEWTITATLAEPSGTTRSASTTVTVNAC